MKRRRSVENDRGAPVKRRRRLDSSSSEESASSEESDLNDEPQRGNDIPMIERNIVRLMLCYDSASKPLRYDDIVKHVLKPRGVHEFRPTVTRAMPGVKRRFREHFGYEVVDEVRGTHQQLSYVLRLCDIHHNTEGDTAVEQENASLEDGGCRTFGSGDESVTEEEMPDIGILVMILAMIVTRPLKRIAEKMLYDKLSVVGIEWSKEHTVFGDFQKLLNRFVAEKYLERIVDEDNEVMYQWSYRAEAEVDTQKVLKMVLHICPPSSRVTEMEVEQVGSSRTAQ